MNQIAGMRASRNSTRSGLRLVDTFNKQKKNCWNLKETRDCQKRISFAQRSQAKGPFEIRIIRQRRWVGKRFVGFSDFNRLTAFNLYFDAARPVVRQ